METRRLGRILRILAALQSGRAYSANALAELVGIARRTIFRDLKDLANAGVHVEYDRATKRYFIDGATLKAPDDLTHRDVMALLMALRLCEVNPSVIDPPALTDAIRKLESQFPKPVRSQCQPYLDALAFHYVPVGNGEPNRVVFQKIQSAIVNRLLIEIKFDPRCNGHAHPIMEPYRLCFEKNTWHVMGRIPVKSAYYAYPLILIMNLSVLTQSYPKGAVARAPKSLRSYVMVPDYC